jgi:hypothetical protein
MWEPRTWVKPDIPITGVVMRVCTHTHTQPSKAACEVIQKAIFLNACQIIKRF